MLGILRRVFSFSDWSQHHPREAPPGDMLDASFDAQTNRISELEQLVSGILRSDGALQNETVSFDSLTPSFLKFFDEKLDESVKKLRFELSEHAKAAVKAEQRAIRAREVAEIASGQAALALDAIIGAKTPTIASIDALRASAEALQAEMRRSAEQLAAGAQDWDDASSEAEAWAKSSALWAEHMPDTLPDNAVKIMDITGDHWSSRWWANQAALIGAEIRDIMLNPQRAGMLTLWYKAIANQTVFPMTVPALDGRTFVMDQAAPEQLDVSVNGIRIMPKPASSPDGDWTVNVATSTVTLLRPLRAGDMVSIDVMLPVEKLAPGPVFAWSLKPLTGMNGTIATFPLLAKNVATIVNVQKTEELMVSLDGVIQEPIASYTAAGASITFATAPAADSRIFITWLARTG